MDHKFNDKGHNLSGSFFLKYGGDALEYFQSDLFDKTTYASKVIVRGRPNIVGPSVRKPIMYFHTAKPGKSRRVINISHTRKTAIIVCSFGTRIPKSSSGVTIFTTRSISNKGSTPFMRSLGIATGLLIFK